MLLELNQRRSRIAPLSSGIDFLGYLTHPRHRLVRRRVVGNLTERLAALGKEVTVEAGGYRWVLYREGVSEYLEAMLSPHSGGPRGGELPTGRFSMSRPVVPSPARGPRQTD